LCFFGLCKASFIWLGLFPLTDCPSIRFRFMNSIFVELWLRFSAWVLDMVSVGFDSVLVCWAFLFLRLHKPQKPDTNASLALFFLFAVDQNAIKNVRVPRGRKLLPSPYPSLFLRLLCLIVSRPPQIVLLLPRKDFYRRGWRVEWENPKKYKAKMAFSFAFHGLLFMVSVCLGL